MHPAFHAAAAVIAAVHGSPARIIKSGVPSIVFNAILERNVTAGGADGQILERLTTVSGPTSILGKYTSGDLIKFNSGEQFRIESTDAKVGDDQTMRTFIVKDC